ncbi:hypothetical protein SDC9_118449 [bioreactor metagenome]|uniref:Uncharacterized protein n=1 Tax=bioreactor metagenome TaxID=1076179 RepID=A0A645C8X7_9ZZZZ|nr:hypothetical protein [Clostridium sp. HMP27]KGK86131.1 hypothetical protein DP68_15045 [Clostridium sp. HMP27]MBE6068749.1 hypothetical protein [Clostridium lundense]
MGFREKINKYYAENYIKKYGDRLSQVQGNVISVKVEEKTILWIFHKLTATLLVKPERSKNVVKCTYKKNRWFKPITFIPVSQGNYVLVQGLKGKKGKENREQIEIMNIRNMTNKKDLIPLEGKEPKVQRVKQKYR